MAVKAVETQAISSVDDLKNAVVDGKKINDVLQDVLVKIQENIDFRKFAEIKKVPNSVFGVYSHMKGKISLSKVPLLTKLLSSRLQRISLCRPPHLLRWP